ncbi:MAG: 4'-phosphopantetheinyl transferase superfamily protein [Clostridia bacterium]|nr:4'-phosphopantetheinyl transferase superfamily protein [Clostridia bacterium]
MRIVAYTSVTDAAVPVGFGAVLLAHLDAIRNPVQARRSCSAWQLLADVLQAEGIYPLPQVAFSSAGKPYFPGNPYYFSITHSKELCAVSLADVPTGVDIEYRRNMYASALIDRVLSAKEKRVYDGDFPKLWCRKECIVKLTGCGLDESPDGVDTHDPNYRFSEWIVETGENTKYQLSAAFLGSQEEEPVKILDLR